MSNDFQRAIAPKIMDLRGCSAILKVSPYRNALALTINELDKAIDGLEALAATPAEPEQRVPQPRVCFKCGHHKTDREGYCVVETLHPKHLHGSYPKRYCACECVFPEPAKEGE